MRLIQLIGLGVLFFVGIITKFFSKKTHDKATDWVEDKFHLDELH